jgi:hypothetical protein
MAYEERKSIFRKIEGLRKGRKLICFFNFDRQAAPPLPGLSTVFASDAKEALFRLLKDTGGKEGIDFCLYTRGGDTNAVWPIVSLIREFDTDFEVIVPFRCHSSGTLVALGARRILVGPLSELSPIDPSTGNQFNPRDPVDPKQRLGISVEDVAAYRNFISEQLKPNGAARSGSGDKFASLLQPFLAKLVEDVHPLALGNVHRVLIQIKQLAANLLKFHSIGKQDVGKVVESLTTRFYSHVHMINRFEAKDILGERVEFVSASLATALDDLLRSYEDSFCLRQVFFLTNCLKGQQQAEVRFIGGAVESVARSYLFETKAIVRQFSRIPPNVQVQIPAGQPMPLIPGLPRETEVEVTSQAWIHNTAPKGVTL